MVGEITGPRRKNYYCFAIMVPAQDQASQKL